MRFLFAALLVALPLAAGGKWNLAYQFDEDESSLLLRSIVFPSDQRGIAIGVLDEKGRSRPVALVTANGGKTWDQVRLKEDPLSVACYTDAVCWISTTKGVWRSEEGGRVWKRISKTKIIMNMTFVSATHGWAAGMEKSAWETTDGGETWNLLPILGDVKANPKYANFLALAFDGNIGIIGGNSHPPRKDESIYPDWMVPEEVSKRREFPALMILLETRNGGQTWSSSTTSVFGTLTALRLRPEGDGATALLEYFHSFQVPSEVLFVDFRTGKSRSVFRDKSVSVTDISLGPKGNVVIAALEVPGLRTLPIPQKVRFYEATLDPSTLSVVWDRAEVDYRVTARRVSLARKPSGELWAVTDTGMILRLDR